MNFQSLTSKTTAGLANVIQTPVGVCLPFDSNLPLPQNPQVEEFMAIWDTGATGSVITSKIVQRLSLKPIGMAQVHTAGGVTNQNQYLINIGLKNGVMVQNVKVTEAQLGGVDVLIGMDIITLGDFSITNFNKNTVMSFRVPSCKEIDYVLEAEELNRLNRPPANRAERRRRQ